jgi:membrane protease YdiL (CAAX protease family)
MLPLAVASRSTYTVHVGIFILFYFLMDAFPHFPKYPLRHLTLLVLYAYAVMLIPPLRKSVGWLRVGKLDTKTWLFLLSAVVLAGLALVAWVRLLSPDLSRWTGMLPKMSFGYVLASGIGLCAFNAAREEIAWRGVMMEALDSALGAGYWSVLIQALSFGLAHCRAGFPNGAVGSAMTFLFALSLGIIRRKSRGMFGCWVAHFLADWVIFCLILHESTR